MTSQACPPLDSWAARLHTLRRPHDMRRHAGRRDFMAAGDLTEVVFVEGRGHRAPTSGLRKTSTAKGLVSKERLPRASPVGKARTAVPPPTFRPSTRSARLTPRTVWQQGVSSHIDGDCGGERLSPAAPEVCHKKCVLVRACGESCTQHSVPQTAVEWADVAWRATARLVGAAKGYKQQRRGESGSSVR